MAAANTDKFMEVGTPGTATTLASPGHIIAGTSITVVATTNWPTATGVAFAIDRAELVNGVETQIAGTYTEWIGTVASATSITNLTLSASSPNADQNYSAGSLTRVYIPVTATVQNKMAQGIVVEHNQDGTHDEAIIQSRTADTAPASGDLILTSDVSASNALKKVTLANLFKTPPVTEGTMSATDWKEGVLPAQSGTIVNNGNRSYDVPFASTVAAILSPGMRLRTTRTVTAPTQCADLEAGSSQYFSKASATGFSTGTTWTFKAKIKPESYATGVICALDDGTNIVQMFINSSGQLTVAGGTTAALDVVTSYQSVALGKWQDVTASITVGTPTGEMRIDDVVVPSYVTASAATTVTISGDETLYIGRNSTGPGTYFDGKIAQVAIFNAIISDATLKTYSSQTMTGSETNCKGFWSLNNTLNDGSASANNLTAFNSAVATNADSPFGQDSNGVTAGTTDYALVMKVSTTTATVQVPEGCTIPTSGGVSAVDYSTTQSPFGFTLDKGKWEVGYIGRLLYTQNTPTQNQWYNLTSTSGTSGGLVFTVPVGAWQLSYQTCPQVSANLATVDVYTTLSTANNTESDVTTTSIMYISATGATAEYDITNAHKLWSVSISSATPYYLNCKTSLASVSSLGQRGDLGATMLRAIPAGI